ncbi:MAG TPA: SCO family protein [Anaerolineales bacterium]|nr:SCO family protein [Anaerolineales bacterium]
MNRRLISIGTAILAVLLLAAGVLVATRRPSLRGSVINPPAPAADIKLTDSNSQPFALSAQRGKVVLLYFGYTNCPDECPATMAKLKLAMGTLGDLAQNVQVVMVTTDPARDDPAQLKKWLTGFYPTFLGLTGTADQLQQAYNAYGVVVENGGETHTTYLYVIDPKGNLRLTMVGPDMDPQDVVDDVQTLLKGY